MKLFRPFCALIALFFCLQCTTQYDLVIRNGRIYDGLGGPPVNGDLAIHGERIAAVGDLGRARGAREIDAQGMAVAPGFVNMLSWSTESLLHDGRSMSEIVQGVTLQVMGEGWSMGPLNQTMKTNMAEQQGDLHYDVAWTTLGEYLDHLAAKGISQNVASFIGATTLRVHEMGYANRQATDQELENMRALVATAMEEGALGIGSSLIYAPAFYSSTEELIELCKVAAEYGGMYISHLRSEGNQIEVALDELIRIAREAKIPAEVYHLKMAGIRNWEKYDAVIATIEAARAEGLRITADMYTYTAGATGLSAAMPPWVQEGGYDAWRKRLQDPETRARVAREMATHTDEWENFFMAAGAEKIILVSFKNEALKQHTGKTLAQLADEWGLSPQETAMNLVVQDGSRVGAIYFLMTEENVKKQIALPWMSFGSDAESMAPEGPFLKSNPHPRAYGNFARLLGLYVREEKVIPLQEAIRKLTSLPASNLGIADRGSLTTGAYADVVIFDPNRVQDHASFEKPHQLATGMTHVFVNGTQVLQEGQHTGAKPGQVVRGPGYQNKKP